MEPGLPALGAQGLSHWITREVPSRLLITSENPFALQGNFHSDWEVARASQVVKNPPANAGDVRDVGLIPREDPLEKGMATHSSILAWRIPWIEEPVRLYFMGLQRVGHD